MTSNQKTNIICTLLFLTNPIDGRPCNSMDILQKFRMSSTLVRTPPTYSFPGYSLPHRSSFHSQKRRS